MSEKWLAVSGMVFRRDMGVETIEDDERHLYFDRDKLLVDLSSERVDDAEILCEAHNDTLMESAAGPWQDGEPPKDGEWFLAFENWLYPRKYLLRWDAVNGEFLDCEGRAQDFDNWARINAPE
jgi:hypothetical protein